MPVIAGPAGLKSASGNPARREVRHRDLADAAEGASAQRRVERLHERRRLARPQVPPRTPLRRHRRERNEPVRMRTGRREHRVVVAGASPEHDRLRDRVRGHEVELHRRVVQVHVRVDERNRRRRGTRRGRGPVARASCQRDERDERDGNAARRACVSPPNGAARRSPRGAIALGRPCGAPGLPSCCALRYSPLGRPGGLRYRVRAPTRAGSR